MRGNYDFVVIGAGSAGCALARRLTDFDNMTVALLESGGSDDHPDVSTPDTYYRLWGTALDWDYESVPQSGTAGRVHRLPRGKLLGGTSSINGMVYLRGAQSDFDGWRDEGCPGWGWADVAPAYDALEELLLPAIVTDPNDLSAVFVEAAQEAGCPLNDDFNSGKLDGCGWNKSNIVNGRRNSSYRAFIHPVIDRQNLDVMTDVHADRLVISSTGKVTGVEVTAAGTHQTIRAGEVIVCAGAYDSPRLLLRSGIGPARHLKTAGVRALIDLPVGENLQDHLLVGVVYDSTRPIGPKYAHITESCAFTRSSVEDEVCDIEISFNKEMHFAPPNEDGRPRYTIIPGVTRLHSRGSVRLAAGSDRENLFIDHAYFADDRDMQAMIAAVRASRAIGEARAFDDWSGGEYFPGPEVETDEQIAQYVRQYVSTWFHPAGTCRMGGRNDAVVGPDLRVLGTSGLRVADASIMPTVVTVNTNAASMMIGWRAADHILDRAPSALSNS